MTYSIFGTKRLVLRLKAAMCERTHKRSNLGIFLKTTVNLVTHNRRQMTDNKMFKLAEIDISLNHKRVRDIPQ